jgi:hypothetical protein
MSSNAQAGLVMIGLAVIVGYTWYVGAWAWLFDTIRTQVAAGGHVQNPRAVLHG